MAKCDGDYFVFRHASPYYKSKNFNLYSKNSNPTFHKPKSIYSIIESIILDCGDRMKTLMARMKQMKIRTKIIALYITLLVATFIIGITIIYAIFDRNTEREVGRSRVTNCECTQKEI